jgi:hypothetical protein
MWDDGLRDGTNPAFTPKMSRKLDAPAPSPAG